jgi:deoxyribose-phosphate aldolase
MIVSSASKLAGRIDQALFAPDASRKTLEQLCSEARRLCVHSLCVNGSRVELARSFLENTTVQVAALVGFPLGAADADAKRFETEIAVDHGAHEIECVLNIGRLKDGDRRYVLRELRDVVEAADERPVKFTLEMHLLDPEQTILACQLALDAGAQFVCNSTDFHAPAVIAADVKLLRAAVGNDFGVIAAGGIKDSTTALRLLDAGATRIGVTDAAAILQHT